MKNELIYRETIQFLLIVICFGIMIRGDLFFIVFSTSFFLLWGLLEFFIMRKKTNNCSHTLSRKDTLGRKILNSFLWVHGISFFIKKYNRTIYQISESGFLLGAIPYLIMSFYILLALLLYNLFGNYGLLIYLLPVITNIFYMFKPLTSSSQ